MRLLAHRAVRGLALAALDPSAGWLAIRMLAWRVVLSALKRVLPLPRLVRLVRGRARVHLDGRPAEQVVALAGKVFSDADKSCLERSMVTYRYLRKAGAEPQLVIGFRTDAPGPSGHAWVTVDGMPVHDSPPALEYFESLVSFDSSGRIAARPT